MRAGNLLRVILRTRTRTATTTRITITPPRFSEVTLLKTMNEAYRYVQDADVKKILKGTDSIGTAAT